MTSPPRSLRQETSPDPRSPRRGIDRQSRARFTTWLVGTALVAATYACDSTPAEPKPRQVQGASSEAKAKPAPPAPTTQVARVPVSPDDPLQGKFTLAEAVEGLPKEGKLVALMKTSLGSLSCELYEDKAPITVANFVGLARGLRPFKDPSGEWTKKPAYDGTTFHRIIKGFMIQGGDPKGTGGGEPGYVIPDEVWPGAAHDERGLLCMANRGPNTNGMQFFILDGAAPHLDRSFTIFGKCSPPETIQKLAGAKTRGDRAIDPPRIEQVTIERQK